MPYRRGALCLVCCTRHSADSRCPGDLTATGDERHGWRISVDTPGGLETYGVLVAAAGGNWRARVLTYPRVLWMVPGGGGSIKFAGSSPQDAERQAIEFIRAHCEERGFRILNARTSLEPGAFDAEATAMAHGRPAGMPARRRVRFLPVQFGVAGPTEKGRTGNLSETGLFVITEVPVEAARQVKMILFLDEEEKLPMKGLVRWTRTGHHVGRPPGMGIQISAPPPRYLGYVRALAG